MEKLTNKTSNVLKYIHKHPYISYTEIQKLPFFKHCDMEEILYELEENGYVSFRTAASREKDQKCVELNLNEKVHLLCVSRGELFMEIERRDRIRWLIPTILSIIALIKSFFPDFIAVAELLSKLLVQ